MKQLALTTVLLAALATLATGCSGSVDVDSGGEISAGDLAEKLEPLVEEEASIEVDSLECADDLAEEKGSEARCAYESEGYEIGVTVISEGDDKIAWQADDQPARMLPGLLEEKSTALLTQISGGQAPDSVDCPEEGLEGEVGATQRCTLTAGEDTLGFTTTVTESGKQGIAFDLEVDEMGAAG